MPVPQISQGAFNCFPRRVMRVSPSLCFVSATPSQTIFDFSVFYLFWRYCIINGSRVACQPAIKIVIFKLELKIKTTETERKRKTQTYRWAMVQEKWTDSQSFLVKWHFKKWNFYHQIRGGGRGVIINNFNSIFTAPSPPVSTTYQSALIWWMPLFTYLANFELFFLASFLSSIFVVVLFRTSAMRLHQLVVHADNLNATILFSLFLVDLSFFPNDTYFGGAFSGRWVP